MVAAGRLPAPPCIVSGCGGGSGGAVGAAAAAAAAAVAVVVVVVEVVAALAITAMSSLLFLGVHPDDANIQILQAFVDVERRDMGIFYHL